MAPKRTAAQIVDAIAEAAHTLLLERSPSAVSIREIAATADVNLGLIHRYVGSKDDVIALVLQRHTERAKATALELSEDQLMAAIADAVARRPATGRLMAGMILDGLDVTELKDEFPLLERMAEDDPGLDPALTYALALGWEVFGPSLLAAMSAEPEADEISAALFRAMGAIRGGSRHPG